ncbi:MAG: tetratricopeptide repeat protein [Simkania sp.]|nr:tetratricopeptide repeat protein [Simkania sp.]
MWNVYITHPSLSKIPAPATQIGVSNVQTRQYLKKNRLDSVLICCCFFFFSFRIPDLVSPPPPPPFVEPPPVKRNEEQIAKLEDIDPRNAEEEYELALYYILADALDQAKNHLTQALVLQPNFLEAQAQMGFVLIWNHQTAEAYQYFRTILDRKPCNKWAVSGLGQVARVSSDAEAITLYQEIHHCEPKNPDALFFLGQLYMKNNQLPEAENAFLMALRIAPQYGDATIQLAKLYERKKDLKALKELYANHPSDQELQHIYARALVTAQNYQQAKILYDQLSPSEQLWKERWELKSKTNISSILEATYTEAKENDPSLHAPVVKDYYFFSALNLLFPIYDQWRLDVKPFFYHQRENDIFPPVGVNYNAYSSGGALTSHYYFTPDWTWNIVTRAFSAWGSGQMNYPFQHTTRFEPGTSLVLNSQQLFVFDAHVESFIIKNFAQARSELLRTDFFQAAYGYRPEVIMHPQVEGWAGWVRYHDSLHNLKNKQSIKAQVDLFTPSLTTFYLFEHSGFKHLNQNYFSYKRQIRSTVELKYHQEFYSRLYFETFWDHTWETTYHLFLPIGNAVFVSPRLYLLWNTFTAQLSYRYKDTLKIEMGGHYLHNTLPYSDWNLRGSFTWQF